MVTNMTTVHTELVTGGGGGTGESILPTMNIYSEVTCMENLLVSFSVPGSSTEGEWENRTAQSSSFGTITTFDNGDTKITTCNKLNCAARILVLKQVLLHQW